MRVYARARLRACVGLTYVVLSQRPSDIADDGVWVYKMTVVGEGKPAGVWVYKMVH